MPLHIVQAEAATLEQLGTARKVTIRATETTIIADAANREEIDMRVKQVAGAEPYILHTWRWLLCTSSVHCSRRRRQQGGVVKQGSHRSAEHLNLCDFLMPQA